MIKIFYFTASYMFYFILKSYMFLLLLQIPPPAPHQPAQQQQQQQQEAAQRPAPAQPQRPEPAQQPAQQLAQQRETVVDNPRPIQQQLYPSPQNRPTPPTPKPLAPSKVASVGRTVSAENDSASGIFGSTQFRYTHSTTPGRQPLQERSNVFAGPNWPGYGFHQPSFHQQQPIDMREKQIPRKRLGVDDPNFFPYGKKHAAEPLSAPSESGVKAPEMDSEITIDENGFPRYPPSQVAPEDVQPPSSRPDVVEAASSSHLPKAPNNAGMETFVGEARARQLDQN